MQNVDSLLAALREEPLPVQLASIECDVFDGLADLRAQQSGRRSMAVAICVAGLVGLVGGLGGGASASAEPLFGTPASAPSHLLAN